MAWAVLRKFKACPRIHEFLVAVSNATVVHQVQTTSQTNLEFLVVLLVPGGRGECNSKVSKCVEIVSLSNSCFHCGIAKRIDIDVNNSKSVADLVIIVCVVIVTVIATVKIVYSASAMKELIRGEEMAVW